MYYVTYYTDLIYFASGDIAIYRYGLLTFHSEPKQVIVQIDNHKGRQGILTADHRTRDTILNRIADRELTGTPLAMLRVALTESDAHHILFAEPDLEDC